MKQRLSIFYKKILITDSCWLWRGSIHKTGYGLYNKKSVHRFSYELFVGSIPKGMLVCHSCDVRNCINPNHLWLGTNQDNMNDMKNKNRQPNNLGENNPFSKLTIAEVKEIKAQPKIPRKKLAFMYNVSEATIKSIRANRNWSHVK